MYVLITESVVTNSWAGGGEGKEGRASLTNFDSLDSVVKNAT